MNPPPAEPNSPKRRLTARGLFLAAGTLAVVATVAGFLGRFSWLVDLGAHFRVQLLVLLAALAGGFAFRSDIGWAAMFGVGAVANLIVIAPLYRSGSPVDPARQGARGVAMLINVNREFGNPRRVSEAVNAFAPDLLVLEEVDDGWLSGLTEILSRYPYSQQAPRDDNFGIALYSRFPIERADTAYFGEAGTPSIVADIRSSQGRFTLIATHPVPPVGPEGSRLRNDQLSALARAARDARSPVLLLGDLNATPWCYPFRRLLRESGLRDSAQGWGVQPSWPTFMPLLWIPIDQCLHSAGIEVVKRSIGPGVGSDHYPLLVEFTLTIGIEE